MNYLRYFLVSSTIWLFCLAPTWAETRFEIKGDTLVFNTEISTEDDCINYDDADKLRDFLSLQKIQQQPLAGYLHLEDIFLPELWIYILME